MRLRACRRLRLLFLALASSSVASQSQSQSRLQPTLHGRFLHITDFHPDEFYKVHSSSAAGVACHRGKGMAGTYGAEKTDCDSPFALVDATLDWVAENIKDDIDFVVWTGDSARHDSDERHPRNEKAVLDSNRAVTAKIVDTFASSRDGRLSVPVIPTLGNNDFLPHNIMSPGPNRWLRAYGDIWRRFIPEDQRHSFQYGGWFYVEVIPDKLAVFSHNTMFFFERNAAVDGCADASEPGYKHMEWLRVQLQRMRQRGLKAILMGHVPPARTQGKQNWDETCWQRYTLWLRQYRDVVTASVFGHMNIDHFLLQDTEQLDLVGGVHKVADDEDGDEGEEDDDGDKVKTETHGDDVSAQSQGDYLQELRDEWSDLPDSIVAMLEEGDDGDGDGGSDKKTNKHNKHKHKKHKHKKHKHKKHKYRNIGGKHAERYHLSFVSPSVVPNYLPTLRVFEYNITGLEHASLWQDTFDGQEPLPPAAPQSREDGEQVHQELKRQVAAEKRGRKRKRGHKKKHGNKGRDSDNLIVPEAPAKESLPGPAHHAQPLTLTGYVQYYANLTYINNDVRESRWRDGNPDNTSPKHKPQTRGFEYQVEYRTADDRFYKLRDLTVKRYLHLAYRMRQVKQECADDAGAPSDAGYEARRDDEDMGDDVETEADDVETEADDVDDLDVDAGKKKNKKRREKNETWLHFLGHAFVNTVSKEHLERM
ncbi:Endopolyphosphatase [Ophiocordyceps sinensis CO18]|uniref:Endopolyphosphatase n=1 Tax=Ophiocordyceps sinensis (strain Co18 / CGMCC 3.14243) TaxID=911162 RepID=T5AA52_OPHSC|nr:Endopolyphosphatase [Ophiocordyceps sinensis CO18]